MLPLVEDPNHYRANVPESLHPINGLSWTDPEAPADVLRSFRLTRELRKAFISYKRSDSQPVADALYGALNARKYSAFLDTASVESGTRFQDVLWDRLADMDLVILLDVRFVIRPPASTALDKPRGLWDLVDVVTENNLIRAIVTWMSPMPFPFAETVALTDLQRAQLESLVRAGSTPQALVFRCRLILRAADRDHPTNLQIAAEFDCNRHTVAGWRNRYLSNGLAGLQDASRSGRPRRFPPRRGSI